MMELPELREFSLVGGTALSLLYGHRSSIDLDLFTHSEFKNDEVITLLKSRYGKKFTMEQKPPVFGIFCYIDNVKVDFVRHPHKLLDKIQVHSGIRMFSIQDIAAMKVQAVLGRGRKKDFWDIAELLNQLDVASLVKFHELKYSGQNLMITVPQAITYFDDASDDEDPMSFKGQTWASVQKDIQTKVSQYLK